MQKHASNPRLPLVPLAAGSLVAACVGAVAAMIAASAAGWTGDRESGLASGLALASVLVAAAAGLALLVLVAGTDSRRLAVAVVAAGVARMVLSLSLGLALFLIVKPEGRTFWTAFLVSNLLCLVVETTWGMVTNQRFHATLPPPPLARDGGVTP